MQFRADGARQQFPGQLLPAEVAPDDLQPTVGNHHALDQQLRQSTLFGGIEFWVRNLVRREGSSFFLQKADGRFYPDFLCQLPGTDAKPGAVLVVEYKGADRWAGAEDDRLIGGLWANLSEGRCRFVMVKDKRWDWIEEALK